MKKLSAIGAAVLFATVAGLSTPAAAQHRDRDDGPRREWQHRDDHRGRDRNRDDRRYGHDDRGRYDRHDRHDRYDRRDDRRYYAPRAYRPAYVYVAPRGYAVNRWRVGARMPAPYYASAYYVDPYAYRLAAPPRGYRWVRVDRDVYMVSIASGVIANVLYDIFR
ncbi:MAG TPA: RcnB family protein [Lysobacter sp.]|nr:RcnB family protein [Lysobacter sp.]